MSYRIIDVIDFSRGEPHDGRDPHMHLEARDIVPRPVVPVGPSDRLWQIVDFVRSQARHMGGTVHCLRIHGHGSPGWFLHGLLTPDTITQAPTLHQLTRLREIFDRAVKCETHLMGCDIAQGDEGEALLRGMANAIGVPVTAGLRSQYGGRNDTFHFEGPTLTVSPGGQVRRSSTFAGRYSGGQP